MLQRHILLSTFSKMGETLSIFEQYAKKVVDIAIGGLETATPEILRKNNLLPDDTTPNSASVREQSIYDKSPSEQNLMSNQNMFILMFLAIVGLIAWKVK
jgi:hypothetical protein